MEWHAGVDPAYDRTQVRKHTQSTADLWSRRKRLLGRGVKGRRGRASRMVREPDRASGYRDPGEGRRLAGPSAHGFSPRKSAAMAGDDEGMAGLRQVPA